MITIKNISEKYGDPITFDGEDLPSAIYAMASAIVGCGYGDGETTDTLCWRLVEGTDYEIL